MPHAFDLLTSDPSDSNKWHNGRTLDERCPRDQAGMLHIVVWLRANRLIGEKAPISIVKTSFNLFMVYTMPKHCFWLRISDFRFGKDIIAVSVTGDVKDYVRSCNTSYDRYPTVCGHFDRSVNRVRIVSFNVVCNALVLFFKAWFVE